MFFLRYSFIGNFEIFKIHLIESINIIAQRNLNRYDLLFWRLISNYFYVVNNLFKCLLFSLLKKSRNQVKLILSKIVLLHPLRYRLFKVFVKSLRYKFKVNVKWLTSYMNFRISFRLMFLFVVSADFLFFVRNFLGLFLFLSAFRNRVFTLIAYWLNLWRQWKWSSHWWILIIWTYERTVFFTRFLVYCVQRLRLTLFFVLSTHIFWIVSLNLIY